MLAQSISGTLRHAAPALLLTALLAAPSVAQTDPVDDATRAGFAASLLGAGRRVSEHTVTIRGVRVDYTATVGAIPLQDSASRPSAIMVYMAYTRRGAGDARARPITFAWNGGPSGASFGVHFGVLGPVIRAVDSTGRPTTPATLTANPQSILDRTDLVMVDPVGTGFSMPVGGHTYQDFYSIKTDAASVAQFIRRYLKETGRLQSPVYLLGESYGTVRLPIVANMLQADSVPVTGMVFIASALDGNTIWEGSGHLSPLYFYLPAYAAIARYHNRLPQPSRDLPSLLREVEQFALTEYATALLAWPRVTPTQRATVLAKLHRYTGLTEAFWEKANLRVGTVDFARELLRDQNRVIQLSDGRQAAPIQSAGGGGGGFAVEFIDAYLANELGVKGAPPYRALAPGSNAWNWFDHGLRQRAPVIPSYQNFLDDLALAMRTNPRMRVQQHDGIYDLTTNYFPANWAMERMNIPDELRGNVRMFDYESGHAVFSNAPSEFLKFTANLAALYEQR